MLLRACFGLAPRRWVVLSFLLLLLAAASLLQVGCRREASPSPGAAVLPASLPVESATSSVPAVLPTAASVLSPTPAPAAPLPTLTPAPTAAPLPTLTPAPTAAPSPTAAPVPTAASPALTGAEVFAAATGAMDSLESFSYEMEVRVSSDDAFFRDTVVSSHGSFLKPDRQRLSLNLRLGLLAIDMETVSIGEDLYVRAPLTGEWSLEPDALEGVYAQGGLFLDRSLAGDVILVGDEFLDGEAVHHLQGVPDPSVLAGLLGAEDAELLGSETMEFHSVELDHWVGMEDLLFRRSVLRVVYVDESGETLTFGGSVDFFGFGEPVDIEAPVVSEGPVGGIVVDTETGLNCDGILRNHLIFQRGASTDERMDFVIAQIQSHRGECSSDVWDPDVVNHAAAEGSVPATGMCFSSTAGGAFTAAEADTWIVGDQPVPKGLLRKDSDDEYVPRTSSGRDSDNNIVVYWASEVAKRPSDGASCWLYFSLLKTWHENFY